VVEKGPLFLNPAQVPAIEQSASENAQKENAKTDPASKSEEPSTREISKAVLVRGPQQPMAAPAPKPVEEKKPAGLPDNENKGALEQMKQDLESAGKLLNPFRW
jgi:hypothetical protein